MRTAQINSSGVVVNVYASSVSAISDYLTAINSTDTAINCPSTVKIGYVYDSESTLFSEPTSNKPEAVTSESNVVADLETIRRGVVDRYVSQWGTVSKDEFWPMLWLEIRELRPVLVEDLVVEDYPAITALMEVSGLDVTPESLKGMSRNLLQYKKAHASLLRKTEIAHMQVLGKFKGLEAGSDELKNWDTEVEWNQYYVD